LSVTTGTVEQVCVSEHKGIQKHAVASAMLRADHGLEGDAHAGPGHRQVSLLHSADIDLMRAKGLELEPGAFGENLVVSGLEIDALGLGSRLAVGEAELEITQIGKECHSRCAIYHTTGDCIMPRRGRFAVVLRGGKVTSGAPVRVLRQITPGPGDGPPRSVGDAAT
jgi:MOSC domain-containing protein YiiM